MIDRSKTAAQIHTENPEKAEKSVLIDHVANEFDLTDDERRVVLAVAGVDHIRRWARGEQTDENYQDCVELYRTIALCLDRGYLAPGENDVMDCITDRDE